MKLFLQKLAISAVMVILLVFIPLKMIHEVFNGLYDGSLIYRISVSFAINIIYYALLAALGWMWVVQFYGVLTLRDVFLVRYIYNNVNNIKFEYVSSIEGYDIFKFVYMEDEKPMPYHIYTSTDKFDFIIMRDGEIRYISFLSCYPKKRIAHVIGAIKNSYHE
ncbi:MAG: hypothetical protein ACRDD8_10595 [Bacteroidales bacterium]